MNDIVGVLFNTAGEALREGERVAAGLILDRAHRIFADRIRGCSANIGAYGETVSLRRRSIIDDEPTEV